MFETSAPVEMRVELHLIFLELKALCVQNS